MLKRVLAFLLSILLLPTTALAAEDTRMEPLSTMESALGGLSVLPVTAPLTPCAVTSFLLHVPGFALAVQTAESINYTASEFADTSEAMPNPKSSAELKAEITARADLIPDDEKVNRIFVNLFDETQIDRVLSENLQGFQYEIVNHFSMTGSYVVEFDSITAAEEAVTILNTLEEVNYAEISVKIRLIE